MLTVLGHNYIGGTRSAAGPAVLSSRSATGGASHPTPFHTATRQEVLAAADSADAVAVEYGALAPSQRATFLEAIAAEIDALDATFITEVARETALPIARLVGERARTSSQLRLFAEILRRGDCLGVRIDRACTDPAASRPDVRQYRIGVGSVAVFGASNFPLAFSVAGGDTASALAAGCPVVVKAHPAHLVTSEIVADAILRAVRRTGMPAGVFNLLYGGHEVSGWLVLAQPIRAVGFTGSLQGGRALCDLAAARAEPIPVFAEMASINPVIVLPGAIAEHPQEVAQALAASVVLGCGQFCTKPGLVLLLRSPHTSRFIECLQQAFASQAAQPMLHGGMLINYRSGIERLAGLPHVIKLAGAAFDNQAAPHLFQASSEAWLGGDEILQEEIFGPATVLIELDACDLPAAVAALRGQLTISVLGQPDELEAQRGLITQLERKAGRLLFNAYPTGVAVCDAMVHGGPYPATSDARATSVGSLAIERFLRPVCYQNYPQASLPPALQDSNPLGLRRLVDGVYI